MSLIFKLQQQKLINYILKRPILNILLVGCAIGFNVQTFANEEDDKATYIQMPRPFLFNLSGPMKQRTVQIKVHLMVGNAEESNLIQKHIPLIEDTILSTFSSAEINKLNTQIGKQELRQKTLLNVQNTLRPLAGGKIVNRVLFTGFVIQ